MARFSLRYALAVPSNVNQVVVDLLDFIPEQYTVNFGVCGAKYVASYGEATVDEVLVLMAEIDQNWTPKQRMEQHRKIVTEFYSSHLASGDADRLRADLALMPYQSNRGSLDIHTLYQNLTARYPKKELGEAERAPLPSRSGLLARLRSWVGQARDS